MGRDGAMWIAASVMFAMVGAVLYPLMRAIGRRIEARGANARIKELEERIAELEHRDMTSGEVLASDQRMAELEERLDFAERLLAQRAATPIEGKVQ